MDNIFCWSQIAIMNPAWSRVVGLWIYRLAHGFEVSVFQLFCMQSEIAFAVDTLAVSKFFSDHESALTSTTLYGY